MRRALLALAALSFTMTAAVAREGLQAVRSGARYGPARPDAWGAQAKKPQVDTFSGSVGGSQHDRAQALEQPRQKEKEGTLWEQQRTLEEKGNAADKSRNDRSERPDKSIEQNITDNIIPSRDDIRAIETALKKVECDPAEAKARISKENAKCYAPDAKPRIPGQPERQGKP